MGKKCNKCNTIKPSNSFEHYRNTCHQCRYQSKKQSAKRYYQEHRKDITQYQRDKYHASPNAKKEYQKQYYQDNKDRIKQYRIDNAEHIQAREKVYRPQYIAQNIHKVRERQRKYILSKLANDIPFRLHHYFSSDLRKSLRGQRKGRSLERLLGYTMKQLKEHLEQQFEPWMNWTNHGIVQTQHRTWQIDHIKPRSLFNYQSYEDTDFKQCWALTNLRPLEAIANLRKSNHYEIRLDKDF